MIVPPANPGFNTKAVQIARLKAENAQLREALKPFADFANGSGAKHFPDNLVITSGSGMARKQLTLGDCHRARAALAPAGGVDHVAMPKL